MVLGVEASGQGDCGDRIILELLCTPIVIISSDYPPSRDENIAPVYEMIVQPHKVGVRHEGSGVLFGPTECKHHRKYED